MCGIYGAAYPGNSGRLSMEALEAMDSSLYRRGPDDHGVFQEADVVLGCRRLSIIDVEGGHQPVGNEDGTVHAVLNGEIYNFQELRNSLQQRGHTFATLSDTEVLVHAYEEYGTGLVSHLNGMFAFAVWDAKKKLLLLARDRLGIKPLYYSMLGDGRLVFASELRGMLACPEVPRELDLVSLDQYLSFEYIPAPRSMIRGISKLRPGHIATYHLGNFQESMYWDLEFAEEETESRGVEDWTDELRSCLREVVSMEMVSDVPIGVFLSGGLDSSSVAAMMQAGPSEAVRSFTIGFEDPSFDESKFARQTAEHLGTDHLEERFDVGAIPALVPNMGEILDEPLGDSSLLPTYLLSQFARKHIKVALGGDGGDELFAGYSTLQAHRLANGFGHLPSFLTGGLLPSLVNRLPVSMNNISLDFRLKRFVDGLSFPPEVRHHRWLGSFTPEEKAGLFTSQVLEQLAGHDTYEPVYTHLDTCQARQPLNQIMYLDTKLYLEGDILQKVDRASMACSLEVRVPLLNYRLVETVMRMPFNLKLKGFQRKHILRKAMAGILPSQIINRKKKGFNIPVARWLRGELKGLTTDMLSPERLQRQGLFKSSAVQSLLSQHLSGQKDHRKLLWTLLAFQFWWDSSPSSEYPWPGAINQHQAAATQQ